MSFELAPLSFEDAYRAAGADTRFLQSPFWAAFKGLHGWQPLFFTIIDSRQFDELLRGQIFSVLVRRAAGSAIAYIPLWPDISPTQSAAAGNSVRTASLLSEIAARIKPYLPKKTLCIRFDLAAEFASARECADWKRTLCASRPERAHSGGTPALCPASSDIQPPDTVILDLALSHEDLLAQMKPKWRYNIRLAEKKGVTVRQGKVENGASEIDVFYDLYLVTAKRDGIAIHSREYYASLLERAAASASPSMDVRLYIAEHEGEPLAAIITLFCPREGVYLYGASSNNKRNLMAAYVLQWTAMCDAKKAGCACYDFYGIPPAADGEEPTESHPMYGLYRFKTGFGGRIVHRAGCVDAPLSRAYSLYRIAESLRSFWYKRVKKIFR